MKNCFDVEEIDVNINMALMYGNPLAKKELDKIVDEQIKKYCKRYGVKRNQIKHELGTTIKLTIGKK